MSEKVKIKIARNVVHLPAIALRGLVVFPNNVVHFEVGRTKSIAAIEAAMHANSSVFLVAQREMDEEEPAQLSGSSSLVLEMYPIGASNHTYKTFPSAPSTGTGIPQSRSRLTARGCKPMSSQLLH